MPLTDPNGNWTPFYDMTDEFDSTSGLNSSKWNDDKPAGWLGRQPGLFDPSNVEVESGFLSMFAKHAHLNESMQALGFANYTTAGMHSKARTKYGYFEMRSKSGDGMVSSSWWFHDHDASQWTEIDVFESGGTAVTVTPGLSHTFRSHTHVFALDGLNGSALEKKCDCQLGKGAQTICSSGNIHQLPFNMSDGFHTFGLRWTPDDLTFFVDNVTVWKKGPHCMHQEIGMDLDRETMPGTMWPEHAPAGLPMGSPFVVDYVRAWKASDTW
jgi:beta-glucanase (GH16 family)